MGLLDDIKTQVKKSGTNKSKFIYFKPGTKVRIRFLNDMEDGIKVLFHDSFALSINVPCQEIFDRECRHCDNEELRHRDQFMWSVWDYEANEVKLLMAPVNNASPIPALVGMYEAYGTLMDRDYVLTKNGTGTTSNFSVVPMDKVKFRNEKAKPYSKSKALELLDKAFPDDESGNSINKGRKPPKDDDNAASEYEEMSPKELYDLCVERGLDVEKKKSARYYINALVDDDKAKVDWDDDGDQGDQQDFESMTPKELYELCKERGINAAPKKSKSYYIEKLEEADKGDSDDDWDGDDESDEDEW